MKRENAWRVFAGEYNESSKVIRGGERSPSYVITPLGAKINKLFIVGVLTDVESLTEGNEFIRAHVSDPTGIYTLYSGQFQPEVTSTLLNSDVPSFVALVGKSRIFEPEEGIIYVSVRPEVVYQVDGDARDRWILETCKSMIDRIEAMREAKKLSQPNVHDLRKLGYSRGLAEGIVEAIKHYKEIDIDRYVSMVNEALRYLVPEREEMEVKEEEEVQEVSDEVESLVLEIIKEIEGKEGALWDSIVERCVQAGLDKSVAEEAIASLLDKGLIYEPVLGTIKTT